MSEPLSREECERLCFNGDMTLEDAYERVVPSLLTRLAVLEADWMETSSIERTLEEMKRRGLTQFVASIEAFFNSTGAAYDAMAYREEVARADRAEAELRLREESQIPVLPHAAKERLDRAEAGLLAAQEALKGLTEAARQVVHADGILSDPEATDAQRVTASQVETEGIMRLAEILVRTALARGGGQQDTGQ